MNTAFLRCAAAIVLALTIHTGSPANAQTCVEGTSEAEYQNGGPFGGMWKYTLDVSWNTGGAGLSHLTFDLNIDCPGICNPASFGFDMPAGTSTGQPEPCDVDYAGSFVCDGDPSIPGQTGPAVKWDEIMSSCHPGPSGSGTFVFYTMFGPGADPQPDSLWIKFGQDECFGELTGDLPQCEAVPVEPSTWGAIKALLR